MAGNKPPFQRPLRILPAVTDLIAKRSLEEKAATYQTIEALLSSPRSRALGVTAVKGVTPGLAYSVPITKD